MNLYKCKYCKKIVERESNKKRIKSFCTDTGKNVKLKKMQKNGIALITRERREQIVKHGYKDDTDKEYLLTFVDYCLNSKNENRKKEDREILENYDFDLKYLDKVDKKPKIEKLTLAGALIAAEIDKELNIKYA